MFIELRLPVESFLRNLRARLKQISVPVTQPLPLSPGGCGGGPSWLDRTKVWDTTLVEQAGASAVRLRQPIDVFVVSEVALRANDVAPSPPCWTGTVEARFTLGVSVSDGVPQMCLAFDGFTSNSVPPDMFDQLPPPADECVALDLAVLNQMFAGAPPDVLAVALVVTDSRIALRIDFDLADFGLPSYVRTALQALQARQRQDFAAGIFREDDPALPWTVLVDAGLMTLASRRQINAGLAEQQDTFRVETTPSTEFLVDSNARPWVVARFSGEVIDACLCAWSEVDLDVDVEASVRFSLPEPDVLEAQMQSDFDLSDLEVACCAITSGFFWLAVGQAWMKSGDMSGGEMAGGTVAQIAFGPAAIALPFMAMAHDMGASKFDPGADWRRISAEKDEPPVIYSRRFSASMGDVGFGPMVTTVLRGVHNSATKGLVLSGTLQPVDEAGDAKLHASKDPDFWAGFDDPCGDDPKLVARFSVALQAHSPGVPDAAFQPLQFYVLKLIEGTDPLGQYGPYLQRVADRLEISIPFAAILPAYRNAPYRPELLVVTNGGARIIRLPRIPLWTAEQIADAQQTNAMFRILHCREWTLSHPFWKGSRYNPLWSVDPGPEDLVAVWQWWEIAVEGLDAGDAVRFDGLDSAHLVTSRANLAGALMMRGIVDTPRNGQGLSMLRLKPGQTQVPPVVVAPAAPVPTLRLTTANLAAEKRRWQAATRGRVIVAPVLDARQKLTLRQRALHPRHTLTLRQPLLALMDGTIDARPTLVVATRGGVTAWALDHPARPRRTGSWLQPGTERLLRWNGQPWLLAGGRLSPLDAGQRLHRPPPALDDAVLDADAQGPRLLLLTPQGLLLGDAASGHWQPAALPVAAATRVAMHHDTVALAAGDRIHVFERNRQGPGGAVGSLVLPGSGAIVALRAATGPGDLYEVTRADGNRWGLSVTGGRLWLAWQSPRGGRIDCQARVGRLMAFGREDGFEVNVAELGGSTLVRRS